MTSGYGEPLQYIKNGQYGTASDLYLQKWLTVLVNQEFDPVGAGGSPIGLLIASLSAAAQREDTARVKLISNILESLIEEIQKDASSPVLQTLSQEWLGDTHLLTDAATATTHYDETIASAQGVSDRDLTRWSLYQIYDYEPQAISRYLDSKNVSHDMERLATKELSERIKYKQDFAAQLVHSERS